MKKLIEVLKLAENYLEQHGIESARLNAERLLADVLGIGRLELYLQFDRPLAEDELELFRERIRRRSSGEPLQYIIGRTGFRGLTLSVGPGVLIPRPETEQLAGLVLDRLDTLAVTDAGAIKVLDLCAGSGALALALAAERNDLCCVLTELSGTAAAWAGRNIKEQGGSLRSPVFLLRCDLFTAIRADRSFDVVVSNPPYVSTGEMAGLPPEVRNHEPSLALAAGAEGLDMIARIIGEANGYLRPGGLLILETGETQHSAVEELFAGQARGSYSVPEFRTDLAGKPRFVIASRM